MLGEIENMAVKQCAVITAYKGREELNSLLMAIHDDMDCFVHIDKKNVAVFDSLQSKHRNVNFYSEYCINWGGYEHLQAILFLLREAAKKEWDYVHIISGEDYPVISAKEMAQRLEGCDEIFTKPFLATGKDYPSHKWYAYRWPYVYFSGNYRNKVTRLFNLACVTAQMLVPPLERKRIGKISEIYHSMVWGIFPRDAIEYVLEYLQEDPKFLKDLQTCKIPEELCISTILMNEPLFRNRIHNRYLRYWRIKPGDWGPPYLDDSDIPGLIDSNAFWARKVKADTSVAQYLSKKIAEK